MLKVAVIGYGGQGAWHCKEIEKSEVVSLKGTYDIRPERMESAKKNGIFCYVSNEEIFADAEVDAVVVATPNDLHKNLCIDALMAGKHVICEKPVVMSVSEFDEICAVAKETGKIFTVHQNRRWDVDFLTMKNIVDSGEIGSLINIESRIHGSRGIPSDWRCEKEHGGGMILDWGVHLIDQILQLVPDKIKRVFCECSHITNKEVDDGFKLSVFFEGGKSAYVEVGTYNFLPLPRFYMQCEKGTALIEDWRKNAVVSRLKAWQEKDVTPVQNAAGITKTMAPRDELTLDIYDAERPQSDVHDFYRNFVKAVSGEEEQLIKHLEVRRVLSVMEAAFESDAKNEVVRVDI